MKVNEEGWTDFVKMCVYIKYKFSYKGIPFILNSSNARSKNILSQNIRAISSDPNTVPLVNGCNHEPLEQHIHVEGVIKRTLQCMLYYILQSLQKYCQICNRRQSCQHTLKILNDIKCTM